MSKGTIEELESALLELDRRYALEKPDFDTRTSRTAVVYRDPDGWSKVVWIEVLNDGRVFDDPIADIREASARSLERLRKKRAELLSQVKDVTSQIARIESDEL